MNNVFLEHRTREFTWRESDVCVRLILSVTAARSRRSRTSVVSTASALLVDLDMPSILYFLKFYILFKLFGAHFISRVRRWRSLRQLHHPHRRPPQQSAIRRVKDEQGGLNMSGLWNSNNRTSLSP